jgi:hypothetical protein
MTLNMLAILLIPCMLLVTVLSFITLNRYISYKERVALAQLGFTIEDLHRDAATRHGSRGVLWGGIITAMSGLALLLGLSTIGFGAWLIGGLLPLFVGLGMVLIYFTASGPAPGATNAGDVGIMNEDAAGAGVSAAPTEEDSPTRGDEH